MQDLEQALMALAPKGDLLIGRTLGRITRVAHHCSTTGAKSVTGAFQFALS